MEHKADVIIYGGTSAAVMAAVEVVRGGRTVLIVCPEKHLGGLSASGLGWTDTGNKKVIGGLAKEFYHRLYLHYQKNEAWTWQKKEEYGNQGQDQDAIDPADKTMWIFEPHVAEAIFEEFINENSIQVFRDEWLNRTTGVLKSGAKITSIKMVSGNTYKGKIFIDATYEGDLMEAAKVSYTIGREACEVYGETWNGVQTNIHHHDHYFKQNISAFVKPGDRSSGSLPRIAWNEPKAYGQGDRNVQAYTYRMCLTKHAPNRVPITKPDNYDPWEYELLIRLFESGWNEFFKKFDPIPNWKTDVNNHGPFSFDNIGMSAAYPKANYAKRASILKEHEDYQKGLLYFVQTDPRVPAAIRNEMKLWGYAKDEFVDNDHWPHQIYVREARRMIGKFVMTEKQIIGPQPAPNSIGMGSYMLDSHNVQRYITADGYVQNEGDIGVVPPKPYQIALGSILPKEEECNNLIIPVAVSSSHTAFGSLRMEPVFMVLGHSAAALAALALADQKSIHEVAYTKLKNKLVAEGQVLSI